MIKVTNLSKTFQNTKIKEDRETEVLKKISLNIKDGEFVTIFGPNGCGKTTFLYLISGIYNPTYGEITINNKSKCESSVGFVFQNYLDSIFPWRNVSKNLEFPLEVQKINSDKRDKIVKHFLKKLNLTEHKDKYLYQLSGGLKQLTAIARSLVYDPKVLLLDEPFSSLDYQTTRNMWLEVLRIWEEMDKTTIFVSHFVDEAVFLADRVIVFSKRPARVIGEVKIDLPRPRKLEMLKTRKFFELRNEVLKFFEEGLE